MKKLLLILSAALMFAFVGCESFGDDNVVGGSYSISGAIQKGPFVQGSNITIQPLNSNLKPIGQMYTTLTTNDAGMFEMEGVNSKYAEIIATGYYYDEVEGKISASPLTLRSIADLKDGAQTNVNILTSLTYNRIKNLVTNNGKGISEAQEQAEKELYTALGIPAELQPNVSCGAMNIANNGEGDGLLLALSAILQEGRSVGELTEYISKFATDLADDGRVEQTLLNKFNLDGQHLFRFEDRIKDNLTVRYEELGVECAIPEFSQYLSYMASETPYYVIPFTYYEDDEKKNLFPDHPDIAPDLSSIKDGFVFSADVDYLGYGFSDGYGEIYLSAAPTIINACRCDVLHTIDIPDGVTYIGESAFEGDKCLEKLGIPDSVTEFGDRAFYDCLSLTNINIPEGLTAIGRMAFFNCWSITSVQISGGDIIKEGTFYNCISLTSVTLPDSITYIEGDLSWDIDGGSGYGTFEGCTSLVNINIPKDVYWIGVSAFESCTSLENINIPDGANFGCRAFYGCSSLKNINIPDIDTINPYVFFGCSSLTSITLPDRLTHINIYTFARCTSLTSINIPTECTIIYGNAFDSCVSLSNVSIPNDSKLQSIEPFAFYNCSSLESIALPQGMLSIGEGVFLDCASLKNINIPDNVTSIRMHTFRGCTSLTSVTIPNSVTEIGSGAFFDCTSLTSITIPDSVTEIGEFAFYNCSSLTSITIPDSVTLIGSYAFYSCTSLASVDIPDSVTSIGNCAFDDCTSLTNVTIGDGVTSIGEWAFYNCSLLKSIAIPDSVTEIGMYAFAGCSSLTSVTFGSCITSIRESAFWKCTSLTNIILPDSVEEIGQAAFYECPLLTSVYCKAITPPKGSFRMFDYNTSGRKIYVPTESVDAYKAAEGWKEYADAIVGYDFE